MNTRLGYIRQQVGILRAELTALSNGPQWNGQRVLMEALKLYQDTERRLTDYEEEYSRYLGTLSVPPRYQRHLHWPPHTTLDELGAREENERYGPALRLSGYWMDPEAYG